MRLPDWVTEVRPHQQAAVDAVMSEFRRGKDLVVLNAPTGSGKTLIAEMVRQELGVGRTSYVCSSLTLQDQFARDFPLAKVVKGRANYMNASGRVPASQCQGPQCSYCPSKAQCPYERAKIQASGAELACLNSTFQLYQSNYGNMFKNRDFIIFDECDELERQLMGFAEVHVSKSAAQAVGMTPPGKGARHTTIRGWLVEWQDRATSHTPRVKEGKDRRTWEGRIRAVKTMLDSRGEWVRQYDRSGLLLKPVTVSGYGPKLWKGDKYLLMSATVISAEQMLQDLGWNEDYGLVDVPMTFPVENRPILVPETVNMAHRMKDTSWPEMGALLQKVIDLHPGENILVHTVSYELTRFLSNTVTTGDRPLHSYYDAASRADTLARFKRQGGVLLAPSMDRGVDFADDHARVVVVCKVPFPNLGDRQVSQRLHTAGGQGWYNVQTVRTIVQMTGRGVRSANDSATTYILDEQFKRLYTQNRSLFPSWWREAISYIWR